MYSYWKYPTNPGTFFDQPTQTSPDPTAPNTATLNPTTGDVTNASTQPLAIYHGTSFPSWCPSQVSTNTCNTVNPLHLSASNYQKAYQGSLGTIGQSKTFGPWGTLDQGGNAVEWTDTITPPPAGKKGARCGGACTAAFRTRPATSSGSRRSACSRRTTSSTTGLSLAGLPHRRRRGPEGQEGLSAPLS